VNFGEKVKQLRAERNLTQPQLAHLIGIEQSYLSKLENDKSIPSADIFQAILKAFSIDVATFLDGVDEKQVYRDLRQVPEVANHLNTVATTRIHDIKAWLFGSAISLALGLTLGMAGWRGLLFSNVQYSYYSPGVLKPGEPTNFFEKQEYLLMQRYQSQEITDKERMRLVQEFNKRFAQDYQLLDESRGQGYLEDVPGGLRTYTFVKSNLAKRPQNRWLMLVGTLFTFGGIAGFIVEARLRQVRL
jgi:transcriptional regulator with XRE-family HTH domain